MRGCSLELEREVGELAGREHRRMVGQDPLDQRRAGARHADDEDRLRGRTARGGRRPRRRPRGRGTRGGVEQLAMRLERLHARRALPSLAANQILKRLGVASGVLELLGKRVAQVQLRVLTQRAGCELALELGELGGRERRARDLRERRPRAVVRGIERECGAQRVGGAREVADELQRRAEVVVVRRFARVARDRAPEWLDGLGVRARARHYDADRVERERGARRELESTCYRLERLARPM